jgi:hypothetical protein
VGDFGLFVYSEDIGFIQFCVVVMVQTTTQDQKTLVVVVCGDTSQKLCWVMEPVGQFASGVVMNKFLSLVQKNSCYWKHHKNQNCHPKFQTNQTHKYISTVKMYSASLFNQESTQPISVIKTSSYPMDEKHSAITLNVKINNVSTKIGTKQLIIVLDVSGSMSGSGIRQATEAISSLLGQVHGHNDNITLITFNDWSIVHPLSGKSLNDQQRILSKLRAEGGTVFSRAFDEIANLQSLSGEVSIIFFTDGQDMYNNGRQQSIQNLVKKLRNSTTGFEFHTIGFTSHHDARLLSEITQLGSTQGTFQYAETSSDIVSSVENLVGLVQSNSMSGNLTMYNSSGKMVHREKLIFEQNGETEFTGTCFLNSAAFNDQLSFALELKQGNVLPIDPSKPLSEDDALKNPETLRLQLKFIEKLLIETANIISSRVHNNQTLKQVHDNSKKLEERLATATTNIQKLKNRAVKRELYEIRESLNESLINFNKILAEALVKNLSNDKIATLNSLAYKSITKRGLKKKLDQRTQTNASLFENLEKMVESAVAQMDFDELKNQYGTNADQIGSCVLSCCNWIEALEQGDCLCLTLDVSRSQAAIADPSQVVIRSVGQSMMSAESFLDSVLYSLGNTYQPESVHGGFNKNASGEVVSGASRESITAVLPLFINEHHWKVAKHKMKPIMGYVTTLDVMGYSYSQVKTIPFLVLSKLLTTAKLNPNGEPTEYEQKMIELVMDTCLQIYRDSSTNGVENKMSEEIFGLVKDYNFNPLSRTIDSVTNNYVFLAQILCAIKNKDLDVNTVDWNMFFNNLAEEELRRVGLRGLDEISDSQLMTLLNIDRASLIDSYVSEFKDRYMNEKKSTGSENDYETKMRRLLCEFSETDSSENSVGSGVGLSSSASVGHGDLNDYDGTVVGPLSDLAQQWIQKMNDTIETRVKPLMKIRNWIDGIIGTFVCSNLTNESLLCMMIQTIQHSRNSTRRDRINSGDYTSPFSDCKPHIKKLYTQLITEKRQALVSEFITEMTESAGSVVANVFARTDNLYEAAGALHGNYRGRIEFHLFIESLKQPVPLVKEKIEMMTSGKFRGVQLFMDTDCVEKPWSPKRSTMFNIWYNNRRTLKNVDLSVDVFGEQHRSYFEKNFAKYGYM